MGDIVRFTKGHCPKCGEPPREMKDVAVVGIPLRNRNTAGFALNYNAARIIKLTGSLSTLPTLICGGGHEWTSEVEQ